MRKNRSDHVVEVVRSGEPSLTANTGSPLFTSQMREPNQAEKNDFYAAMEPRWNEIATLLAADRPPDWQGFRFEARAIGSGASPGAFTIEVKFGDRVSNRLRGGVHRSIVDKLAALRILYLDFSPMATWRTVTIKQIWNPASKSWSFETNWTY